MAHGIVLDDKSVPGSVSQTIPLPVRIKEGTTGNDKGGHLGVGDGTKAVTDAGTRVQLSATSVPCKRVYVQSHEDNGALANGGLVVVGAVTCVAAANGRRGRALYPTQGEWFNVNNLNLLYLDSLDDGAKVHYYYET